MPAPRSRPSACSGVQTAELRDDALGTAKKTRNFSVVDEIALAAREGLEPPTLALGKPCSIRLSYRATRGSAVLRHGGRFGNGRAPDDLTRPIGSCERGPQLAADLRSPTEQR